LLVDKLLLRTSTSSTAPSGTGPAESPRTGGTDTTPPVISSIAVTTLTATSATITWTTNEPASSQVEYRLPTGYEWLMPLDPALVTSHSVVLSNLTAGTLYHYRVRSKDAAGNEAFSADGTFTTAPPSDTTPPTINSVSPQASPSLYAGDTLTVGVSVTDTDPSPLEYQFSVDGVVKQVWSTSQTYAWVTTSAMAGRHTSTVEVRDAGGAVASSQTLYLYARPPMPPVATPPPGTPSP
jgi:hypothetical protein